MAKLAIKKGTTSKLLSVFIADSSSKTGAGLTGLVAASAGLASHYYREGAGSGATVISLVALGSLGTWESGGFFEIDSVKMPGWYEFGVPNAVLAAGADSVGLSLRGATNMAPVNLELQLTGLDLNDAVRGGMTALPSAAADAAGGLAISDAGGLDLDAIGSNAGEIGTGGIGLTNLGGMHADMQSEVATMCMAAITSSDLAAATNLAALVATIGTAGAGLTDLGGMSAGMRAEVEAEAGEAIASYGPATDDGDAVAIKVWAVAIASANAAGSIGEALQLRAASTEIAALNNLSAADVNAQVDAAIADAALATGAALAAVDGIVDAILAVTGTTLDGKLDAIQGAAFNSATDSLEAIRDRGDAAWTTGAGGSSPTVEEIRAEIDVNSVQLALIITLIQALGGTAPEAESPVANMMEMASAWLNGKRHDHQTSLITYERGTASTDMQATIGTTTVEQTDEYSRIVQVEIRDFIIQTDDLILDAVQYKPQEGDLIREVTGAKTFVHEVMSIGSEPAFRYSDPFRNAWRIHTKHVRTEVAGNGES